MIRLLQLSDCHLGSAAPPSLVPPETRWRTLTTRWRTKPFDTAILTGDLVDTPAGESLLAEGLETLGHPFWLLPGNHDDPARLARRWPEQFLQGGAWKRIGELHVALLDSHWPGKTAGRLGTPQLQRLEQWLATSTGPVLLFLHHPPCPVGSTWIDALGLHDAEALAACLHPYRQRIQGLFFGHVHQEFTGEWAGLPCFATPSTWVQFAPGREDFAYDHRPGGLREILWDGGCLTTQVHWVGDP